MYVSSFHHRTSREIVETCSHAKKKLITYLNMCIFVESKICFCDWSDIKVVIKIMIVCGVFMFFFSLCIIKSREWNEWVICTQRRFKFFRCHFVINLYANTIIVCMYFHDNNNFFCWKLLVNYICISCVYINNYY